MHVYCSTGIVTKIRPASLSERASSSDTIMEVYGRRIFRCRTVRIFCTRTIPPRTVPRTCIYKPCTAGPEFCLKIGIFCLRRATLALASCLRASLPCRGHLVLLGSMRKREMLKVYNKRQTKFVLEWNGFMVLSASPFPIAVGSWWYRAILWCKVCHRLYSWE